MRGGFIEKNLGKGREVSSLGIQRGSHCTFERREKQVRAPQPKLKTQCLNVDAQPRSCLLTNQARRSGKTGLVRSELSGFIRCSKRSSFS